MRQIDSISFFDPNRRKAANPDERPTEGQRVCPKCGSENYHETDSISDSDRRRPVRDYLYCYDCGHKKKVR